MSVTSACGPEAFPVDMRERNLMNLSRVIGEGVCGGRVPGWGERRGGRVDGGGGYILSSVWMTAGVFEATEVLEERKGIAILNWS